MPSKAKVIGHYVYISDGTNMFCKPASWWIQQVMEYKEIKKRIDEINDNLYSKEDDSSE